MRERLRRFISEVHRRSLWQVLGIYVVASWAVLGGIGTLVDVLLLPEWFPSLALGLLIVGLPVVLATAFVQEGGPGRDQAESRDSPVAGARGWRLLTWRNAIGGGVVAFALWGVVAAGWVLTGGGIAPSSIEQSIAVLPFEDLSPEGDQQYFVEGLSEEIINALAQIGDLKVAARTSTFVLAEQHTDIATVASTLGVANVLEGSVRKSGDKIRITAQLIEAASSFHLWSDTFDRELLDVFAIQEEIAQAISNRLQVTLVGGEQTQLVSEATGNPEAHEAYLRGRYLWNQRTVESLRNAIAEFERAIDLDPEYAEAHSGLADSYLLLDTYIQNPAEQDFPTNLRAGLDAARRAVTLAPDLGVAHTSLAYAHWNLGEWDSAEREFEQAIALSPGYATAHQWYSLYLNTTGRANEAVAHGVRALELDPVSQVVSVELAGTLDVAGRFDEAISQARETTELAPGWPVGWIFLALASLNTGAYETGLEAWVQSERLGLVTDLDAARSAYQAMIRYRETGEPQAIPEHPTSWGNRFVRALAGHPDGALEIIEEHVRAGAYGRAAQLHVQSRWGDLVGDDPRYQALLEEAGITW